MPPQSGLFQFKYLDRARKRNVSGEAYLPRAKAPYPAVIFSHGTSIPLQAYRRLAHYWSQNGYAALLIRHDGASEDIRNRGAWGLRPRDVSFLIDEIERAPLFRGIDKTRIAAAGHSHGAHTTLLLAGAGRRFQDRRLSAFIALSPPGANCMGLRASSFARVEGPLLCMSGTKDIDLTFRKPASWRRDPFRFSPKGDKYHLLIDGADHYSFFDAITICGESFTLPDERALACVESAVLAFLDHYLARRPRKTRAPWRWRLPASGSVRLYAK